MAFAASRNKSNDIVVALASNWYYFFFQSVIIYRSEGIDKVKSISIQLLINDNLFKNGMSYFFVNSKYFHYIHFWTGLSIDVFINY